MLSAMLETHEQLIHEDGERYDDCSIESDEEAMSNLHNLLEYFIQREYDADDVLNMYYESIGD